MSEERKFEFDERKEIAEIVNGIKIKELLYDFVEFFKKNKDNAKGKIIVSEFLLSCDWLKYCVVGDWDDSKEG